MKDIYIAKIGGFYLRSYRIYGGEVFQAKITVNIEDARLFDNDSMGPYMAPPVSLKQLGFKFYKLQENEVSVGK